MDYLASYGIEPGKGHDEIEEILLKKKAFSQERPHQVVINK